MTVPSVKQVVIIAKIQVNELNSCFVSATAKDGAGVVVPLASITGFTVQIYDDLTGDILNTRDNVSILNVAGGTFDATSGAWTFRFRELDNPIHGSGLARGAKEKHTARFTLTWGSDGRWDGEVQLSVVNLNKVP